MAGLLKRKLEREVEIREGAGDVFHDFFANRPHHLHTVNDEFVQGCDLHEGDYGTPGSTIEWRYTVEGKPSTIKQILEVIDEENKVMKFNCIEGDLMKDLKTFVATFKVLPKDEETCIVRWTFEYEKVQEGLPEPGAEMDALIKLAKEIDEPSPFQKLSSRKAALSTLRSVELKLLRVYVVLPPISILYVWSYFLR